MDRKLNALFLFFLVIIFIAIANTAQQWNILLGLLLASSFSLAAFLTKGITLDGMFAAIVIGAYVLGLGGWAAAIVLLLFFLTSLVISDRSKKQEPDIRRDGLQVWANGFWLIVFLTLLVIFDAPVFTVGAMAAVATAAADTWATELGSDNPNSTYLITTFDQVKPGTDGGVSLKGTFAALAGAALIAGATVYFFSLHFSVFIISFTAAFLGCLIDSYFGALYQQEKHSVILPILNVEICISNNFVNAVSTGIGGLLAIILNLIFA